MTLPVPNLDDRSFQDIVDEAKRLIPSYCPEWTNHNLSDPGVALIELFAWMTEMTLFRLNQVPDAFYTQFLDLVGIEPFPAAGGAADLTFWLSTALERAGGGAGGHRRSPPPASVGDDAGVHARSTTCVIVQPELVARAHRRRGDEDATPTCGTTCARQRQRRLLPAHPVDARRRFYLGFERSLAGNVSGSTSRATVEGIGVDPRPPAAGVGGVAGRGLDPVRRCYERHHRRAQPRRHVVLLVPTAHEPLTLGGRGAYWLRAAAARRRRRASPTYRTSPQVRTVSVASLGGTVARRAQRAGRATRCSAAATASPTRCFEVRQHAGAAPRSRARRSRSCAGDERRGRGPRSPTSSQSGPTTATSCGTRRPARSASGPRIRYPDGIDPPARRDPARRRADRRHRLPLRRRRAGNVGAGHAHARCARRSRTWPASRTCGRPLGGVDAETVDNAKRRGPLTLRTGAAGRHRAATSSGSPSRPTRRSPAPGACRPPSPGGPIRLLVVPAGRAPDDAHAARRLRPRPTR